MVLLELLGQATTTTLVATRLAGFVVVSPFPGERVHTAGRMALVVVLAFLVAHTIPGPEHVPEIGLALVVPALTELMCGILMGACFRFVLAAADVVGGISAQTSGLGSASLYDPSIGATDTVLGTAMGLLSLCLALSTGTHRIALAYLIESFRSLPVGGPIAVHLGAPVLIDLGGQCLSVGVRLALPVIAVSLAVQSALAMIARAAPSLQIFSIGFSVLIVTGLLALAASLPAIGSGLLEQSRQLGPALDRLFEALASP